MSVLVVINDVDIGAEISIRIYFNLISDCFLKRKVYLKDNYKYRGGLDYVF